MDSDAMRKKYAAKITSLLTIVQYDMRAAAEQDILALMSEVAEAARAECEKVCRDRAKNWAQDGPDGQERERGWCEDEANWCAEAIRRLPPATGAK